MKKTSITNPGPLKQLKWSTGKTKFMYLASINRPITPHQVTKLAESITAMGVIRPVVVSEISFITGKKETYIIDGQHLYNALLRLGMAVPYVYVTIKDKAHLVETIAKLNASSKSWTMQDYVTAWGSINPDYIKLNEYFQQYDFELTVLAGVLANSPMSKAGSGMIKSGNFKVENENTGRKLLDCLTDAISLAPRRFRFETKYFCTEYIQFFRAQGAKYNHTKFMNNMKKNKSRLNLAVQEPGALVELFKGCIK